MTRRTLAFLISFFLIFEQAGFAQVAIPMGIPGYLSSVRSVADKFRPVHLRSIDFNSGEGDISLVLDKGDSPEVKTGELNQSAQELFRYFQVGLVLPNKYFWVNLRPDSPDDVIEPLLEKTDVGQIMLAADLQLKKDLANFTSPQAPEGKLYWDRLYAKASELYSQQDIEIPTLTRPWIVPGEVIIRESQAGVFVYKATLKVMLEQDYIKDSPAYNFNDPRQKELNSYSSELIRELIIPRLTREVNSSRSYAQLRQVYYSLILAQWVKQGHKVTRSQVTSKVDSQDLSGLTSKASWSKDTYYQAYRKSFQKGEYNRQEQVSSVSGLSIRQYFSGGIVMDKPFKEWTVIPEGIKDFFAANQQYFARLVIDPQTGDVAKLPSGPVLTDGGAVQRDVGLRDYVKSKSRAGEVVDIEIYDESVGAFDEYAGEKAFKALRKGKAVAFSLSKIPSPGSSWYNDLAWQFAYIADDLSELMGDDKSIAFPIREGLKNAFFHGNAADFSLPLYIDLELNDSGRVLGIRLVDFAKEKTVEKHIAQGVEINDSTKPLSGEHSAIEIIKKDWKYEPRKPDEIAAGLEVYMSRSLDGGMAILDKSKALRQIAAFGEAMIKDKSEYQHGLAVEIPPGVDTMLVGDLHARLDNLKKILNHKHNLRKIKEGKLVLVILGDAVHSEKDLKEMASSVEMMQFIMELKIRFPKQVYYLLGNHDYLSGVAAKDGVQQGFLYRGELEKRYGKEYINQYINNFIRISPIEVVGDGFAANHSGPIMNSSLEEIELATENKEFSRAVQDATQSRWQETFGEDYVEAYLESRGQPNGVMVIGHSPQSGIGWHWEFMKGKLNIIYAANEEVGYILASGGKVERIDASEASAQLNLLDGGNPEKALSINSQTMINRLWNGFVNPERPDLNGKPTAQTMTSKSLEDFRDYLKKKYYFPGTEKLKTETVQSLANDLGINLVVVHRILNMLVRPSAEKKRILHTIYIFKASRDDPFLTIGRIEKQLKNQGINIVVYNAVDLHVLAYLGLVILDSQVEPRKELKIIGVNQELFKSIYPEIEVYGDSEVQKAKTTEDATIEIFLERAKEDGITADDREKIEEILFGDNYIDKQEVAERLGKKAVSGKGVLGAKKKILGYNRQEMERLLESGSSQENGETGAAQFDGGEGQQIEKIIYGRKYRVSAKIVEDIHLWGKGKHDNLEGSAYKEEIEKDALALFKLSCQIYPEKAKQKEKAMEYFRDLLQNRNSENPRELLWVYRPPNQGIKGYLTAEFFPYDPLNAVQNKRVYLSEEAVDSEFQGQGVAKAMLLAMMGFMEGRNVTEFKADAINGISARIAQEIGWVAENALRYAFRPSLVARGNQAGQTLAVPEAKTIRLKNIVTGKDFELRETSPGYNSFSVWIDDVELDSLFEFDEDRGAIRVHTMGVPSEYTAQGIGLTVLRYLAERAKMKGKDLVLHSVLSYAVARMCFEHISENAQYRIEGENWQSFEQIDWFDKLGPIVIGIADRYFLKYEKEPGSEELKYLLSQNDDLQARDENEFAKTISVRLENGKIVAARTSSFGNEPLAYQVFLSEKVLEVLIKSKDIQPGNGKADGGSPKEDLGGIDFRELPVSGQPAPFPALMPQLQQLAENSLIKDLDQEWSQIRGEMLAPEMPYNRIKEYIAVCLSRTDSRKNLDQAVSCIIDILRMEEEQALATNQELKDILMCLS